MTSFARRGDSDAPQRPHVDIPLVPRAEADPLKFGRFEFPHEHAARVLGRSCAEDESDADGWDAACVCV